MIIETNTNTYEPYTIIHNDGKLLAFVSKEYKLDETPYYNGYIVIDDTHAFFGLEDYQIQSELSKEITLADHTTDGRYIFGFDDVYNDKGYGGVLDTLKEMVLQCLPLVNDVQLSISNWFHIAKPKPTNQNVIQQLAYHFEEVAEMCQAIHCDQMAEFLKELKTELLELDENQCTEFLKTTDRLALLDALCDQQVTANGVGTLLGFDMPSALIEVNESNYTKFEDGKAVINSQGKITKGKNYRKPKLEQFI